jgi:hypothetical protein
LRSSPEGGTQKEQLTGALGSLIQNDHIAYGPMAYLDKISDIHKRLGSKISKQKHGISDIAVKYCEKILYLKGRNLSITPKAINYSDQSYEDSIFVDSIKVRLLSPISKSIDIQNDRNIAIGKAKSFGRTLRWLNPTFFNRKWVEMVRTRFIRRMKRYLPMEGTSLFNQILLPEELGGLDLYLTGELASIIEKCPIPTQQFVFKLIRGEGNFLLCRRFKTFTSNGIQRGYDFKSNYIETLEQWGPGIDDHNIFDVRDQLNIPADISMRKLFRLLSRKGWMTFDDLLKESLRGVLFEDILSGLVSVKKFSTEPWKLRYQKLWDATYQEGYDIADPDIKSRLKELEKISRFLPLKVYNVEEEIDCFDPNIGQMVKRRFIDDITSELPDLKIRAAGLLSTRIPSS